MTASAQDSYGKVFVLGPPDCRFAGGQMPEMPVLLGSGSVNVQHSLVVTEHLSLLSMAQPNKPALQDDFGMLTYAELDEAIKAFGSALLARGVRSGDRVALAMSPSLAHAVAILGCMASGAIACVVNVRLAQVEIHKYLDRLKPALAIADPIYAEKVQGLVRVEVIEGINSRMEISRRLHPLWSSERRTTIPSEDDPCLIFPTGGTTGIPKGAVYSQRSIWLQLASSTLNCGRASCDKEVFSSPFFHVGILSGWMSTLFSGGTSRILPGFDVDAVLEAISAGATFMMGGPTTFARLRAHPSFEAIDRSRIQRVRLGTAAADPAFIKTLFEDFPNARLLYVYGTTEFGAVTSIENEDFRSGRFSGVGMARPGAKITVVDQDLQPVPAGVCGELLVDSIWRSGYYWDDPEETAATYLSKGVRIGDMGCLDDNGWLTIKGRKKEIIISGGENVFPSEVEEVIARHTAVDEVVVYGACDAEWGERVEAAVVLRAGQDVDAATILEFARLSIAGYKLPKRVRFVNEIPQTTISKPDRARLRREAEADDATDVSTNNSRDVRE